MIKKLKASQLLSTIALMFFSSLSFSETPKTCPKFISEQKPFIYEGCSGEACGYLKYDKANRKVELHAEPNTNSKVIGHVEKCNSIKDAKFFTSVNNPGEGIIVSTLGSEKNLKVGQQVKVIRSLGEGYWEVCANDYKIFTATDSPSPTELEFKLIKQPKTQDWLRLKTSNGLTGYAKDSSPRFFMGYYDFDPNGFCNEDHPLGPNVEDSKSKLSSFITQTLNDACSKYHGCTRTDPSLECPIDLNVWNLLSKELKKYSRLLQCDSASGGYSCTNDWAGEFSCTYNILSTLNPNIANQAIFQYSCKKTLSIFDCKLD